MASMIRGGNVMRRRGGIGSSRRNGNAAAPPRSQRQQLLNQSTKSFIGLMNPEKIIDDIDQVNQYFENNTPISPITPHEALNIATSVKSYMNHNNNNQSVPPTRNNSPFHNVTNTLNASRNGGNQNNNNMMRSSTSGMNTNWITPPMMGGGGGGGVNGRRRINESNASSNISFVPSYGTDTRFSEYINPSQNNGFAQPSVPSLPHRNTFNNNNNAFDPNTQFNQDGAYYGNNGYDNMDGDDGEYSDDEEEDEETEYHRLKKERDDLIEQYGYAHIDYPYDFPKSEHDVALMSIEQLRESSSAYKRKRTHDMALSIGRQVLGFLVFGIEKAVGYIPVRMLPVWMQAFKPKLNGWSTSVQTREINDFNGVIVKLWVKYLGSTGDMSPEFELAILLAASAFSYHTAQQIAQFIPESSVQEVRNALWNNPEIMQNTMNGIARNMDGQAGAGSEPRYQNMINEINAQAGIPSIARTTQAMQQPQQQMPPQMNMVSPQQQSQQPPMGGGNMDFGGMLGGIMKALTGAGGAGGGGNPLAALFGNMGGAGAQGGAGVGNQMLPPPPAGAPQQQQLSHQQSQYQQYQQPQQQQQYQQQPQQSYQVQQQPQQSYQVQQQPPPMYQQESVTNNNQHPGAMQSRHMTEPEPYPIPLPPAPIPIPQVPVQNQSAVDRNIIGYLNGDMRDGGNAPMISVAPQKGRGRPSKRGGGNRRVVGVDTLVRPTLPPPASLTPLPQPIHDRINDTRALAGSRIHLTPPIQDATSRHQMSYANNLISRDVPLMLTPGSPPISVM